MKNIFYIILIIAITSSCYGYSESSDGVFEIFSPDGTKKTSFFRDDTDTFISWNIGTLFMGSGSISFTGNDAMFWDDVNETLSIPGLILDTLEANSISDHFLTISGGNITDMGNITGTDIDISAGTGDFSTSGLGAFGIITVDNITIDGTTITSDTGFVNFNDDSLVTSTSFTAGNPVGNSAKLFPTMLDITLAATYDFRHTSSNQDITFTISDGGVSKSLIQLDADIATVKIAEDLFVNTTNVADKGLRLFGSGSAGSTRGGLIGWVTGTSAITGYTYVSSGSFVWDNALQSNPGDMGNASINFITGALTCAGGDFDVDLNGNIIDVGSITGDGDFLTTANLRGTVLFLNETGIPTPIADVGAIWTNSDNELRFISGDGQEHLLHGDAFSNIAFHAPSSVEVTISTQDSFTVIDSFTVVKHEDDLLNVVGNTSTNTLTLSSTAGGEYQVSYHGSITATGGADKEMSFVMGINLATPKDITNVTDNGVSPIVITSVGHGLDNGDMVEIEDVVGNTAANGSFIVDNKATDTFEIVALDAAVTTGNGDYNEGSPTGDITIEYPMNMEVHRMVRGADFGSISATGLHVLAASDVLKIYVANLSSTTNLTVSSISFSVFRIGD